MKFGIVVLFEVVVRLIYPNPVNLFHGLKFALFKVNT